MIEQQLNRVFVALGGNLGQVQQSFKSALSQLSCRDDTSVLARSRLYQTPPLGPVGQPDYLNAVVEIKTQLMPLQLLDLLQQIELAHGRERKQHWGARTLDLDIIDYAGRLVENDRLTLPHAELAHRMFVLRPLYDIAPEWLHPLTGKSVHDMLQALLDQGEYALSEGVNW